MPQEMCTIFCAILTACLMCLSSFTKTTTPVTVALNRLIWSENSGRGFESDEIDDALTWLRGLKPAAPRILPFCGNLQTGCARAVVARTLCNQRAHLPNGRTGASGFDVLGFISFLESVGVLPASMREVVIDRAMAAPGAPVSLDDLKIIILMVLELWPRARRTGAGRTLRRQQTASRTK